MNIPSVGLDLAKSVFHVICLSEQNKAVKKRIATIMSVSSWLNCRLAIVMDACAPLINGGCTRIRMVHEVEWIPPQ